MIENILDVSGKTFVSLAVVMNVLIWIGKMDINMLLTVILSILGVVYFLVKIYIGWLKSKDVKMSIKLKEKELTDK